MVPVAQKKGLTLKVVKTEDLLVLIDVDKLEKIILNLLANALKFTARGAIRIDYGKRDEAFFIAIEDTGKGIPEDKIPLILNRFFRIDSSDPTGFGIGLALVKELVTTLDGTIEVESKVNSGTTFRIILPSRKL